MSTKRDLFGTVPLYMAGPTLLEPLRVGRTLASVHAQGVPWADIRLVPAGHEAGQARPWVKFAAGDYTHLDRGQAARELRKRLDAAVVYQARPGPTAVSLSGGIDSAMVAASLVLQGHKPVAFTAVHDPASPDVKNAREVAATLGLEHVLVDVPAPSLDDLEAAMRVVEMPYKAQVEIGYPCLLVAEAIAAHGITAVFTGEGADELWGSHAFAFFERSRPGAPSFQGYRWRDFQKQASRNFIREWKVYAAHGVDVFMPFTAPAVVSLILGLAEPVCRDSTWQAKRPAQMAYADILPEQVRSRQKLGYQDGLGIKATIGQMLGLEQAQVKTVYHAMFRSLFPGARYTWREQA